MIDGDRVYVRHCCLRHGCKYGDDEGCPVATGQQVQDHPCEFCQMESANPDTQQIRKLEQDLKDERFVVMKLKERLDAVRDELGAAKALWLGIHTTPYHIESDDTTVRIPTLIYERLNDLLGKGVELEAR